MVVGIVYNIEKILIWIINFFSLLVFVLLFFMMVWILKSEINLVSKKEVFNNKYIINGVNINFFRVFILNILVKYILFSVSLFICFMVRMVMVLMVGIVYVVRWKY